MALRIHQGQATSQAAPCNSDPPGPCLHPTWLAGWAKGPSSPGHVCSLAKHFLLLVTHSPRLLFLICDLLGAFFHLRECTAAQETTWQHDLL